MSSYVFMKVLESTPERYDRGIGWLSGGRMDAIYHFVAERAAAAPGRRILDLGCGTGGVSLACAALGAEVVGIDQNPGMLDVARAKALPDGATGSVSFLELGALEVEDRFETESFDAVVSCLMFSELNSDEQSYVLRTVRTRLRAAGRLVVADEVLPPTAGGRLWYRLRRIPLSMVTWLATQTSTRAVPRLLERVREAGFSDAVEARPFSDAFAVVAATRPEEQP